MEGRVLYILALLAPSSRYTWLSRTNVINDLCTHVYAAKRKTQCRPDPLRASVRVQNAAAIRSAKNIGRLMHIDA